MPTQDLTEQRFTEVRQTHISEYGNAVLRFKAQGAKQEQRSRAHETQQLELLRSAGMQPDALEQGLRKDANDLAAHLADVRPPLLARSNMRALDAKQRAVRAATLGASNHLVLPPHGASLLAPDVSVFTIDGEIGSGWIFPSNPGQINVKTQSTGHGTGWGATAGPPPPEYNVYFTFVPARLASYSLTAVFAFHGFYVLRADDGFLTHKFAKVSLDVAMNVNQYVDFGWKSFPSPISRDESNVNEVDTYDRTHFFDYTTVLKEGDAVVVTVRLTLDAVASGGGSYAEINFDSGTANYIEPLFLSVGPG